MEPYDRTIERLACLYMESLVSSGEIKCTYTQENVNNFVGRYLIVKDMITKALFAKGVEIE